MTAHIGVTNTQDHAAEPSTGVTQRVLRGVAGQFATGVTVVIALIEGQPHATTASSFVPVSFDPPLVAVFFAMGSRMHECLRQADRYSINILGAMDSVLANRFAQSGRTAGWAGLADLEIVRHAEAPPILGCALAWLDCASSQVAPMGDHTCFVGRVLAAGREPDAEPLVHYRGRFHELGRVVAPTRWLALDSSDLAAAW
jgi:flavin reductase (DIM6/NTAB) family NADH-FMN oxidoreductase RutF